MRFKSQASRSMAPRKKSAVAATKEAAKEAAKANMMWPQRRAPPSEEVAWKDPTIEEKHLLKLVKDGLLLDQAIA